MALRIRCSECSKRISIDEAFAGGACRCPYCTAVVFVPGGPKESTGLARPAEPGARPQGPESPVPGPPGPYEDVPVAQPVKLQGIITIILLGLLVLILAGGAVLVVTSLSVDGEGEGDEELPAAERVNPFVPGASGPAVGELAIETPVVYCIDAGSSMSHMFSYAEGIVLASIGSLRRGDRFAVLLSAEGADKIMPGGYHFGEPEDRQAASDFMSGAERIGAADITRSLAAAVAMEPRPRTVVLFARKPVEGAPDIAARAARQGTAVVTVSLDASSRVKKSMAALADASGGRSISYAFSELQEFAGKTD